jgi:hypothetical protein
MEMSFSRCNGKVFILCKIENLNVSQAAQYNSLAKLNIAHGYLNNFLFQMLTLTTKVAREDNLQRNFRILACVPNPRRRYYK